jgi:hypothetical protein
MGVARQLQVKARFAGFCRAARLVGQQQAHARFGRRTGDGGVRIAAMCLVEMVRAPVGHTGHHQGRCLSVTVVVQHHVFVHQNGQPQAAQRLDPGVCAGVVLVVACHKESAMARAQPGQRRHMGAQLRHRAVDQVAGHGHHVRTQAVHGVHDALQVTVADRGPDVDIADLRHGEAVQCRGQPGHRHLHGHDGCRAPSVQKAQRGHQRGRQQHRKRAGMLQRGALPGCGALGTRQHADQRVGQAGQQPHRVSRQCQHEQRGKQPHAQQAGPDQRGAKVSVASACQQRRWRQPGGGRQQHAQRPGRVGGQGRQQAPADIGMQERGNQEQGSHSREAFQESMAAQTFCAHPEG